MQVAEIFDSIEGESFNAGKLTTFVRFSGCNLKCKYCDTKWANIEKGLTMSKEEITEMLKNTINVTLTGGEPLLQKELKEFLIYWNKLSIHPTKVKVHLCKQFLSSYSFLETSIFIIGFDVF